MINLKDKRIAITGGAGLIGSYLADELAELGSKVIVIDDFSKGLKSNLEKSIENIEIREGDLEDRLFASESLADADIVFHLASRAYGVGYSRDHHMEALLHNERINNNVIEAMVSHQPEHVLMTSSSCVYSDDGPDTVPEIGIFEGEPEIANWGYGWAKRFLEQKARILFQEKNIPTTIVRPFNIYGERYRWVGEYSQAIPMLVKRVLDDENPMQVWGSGKQSRTYIHAKDCARIMTRLVELRFTEGPINIGLEETISINDLVAVICRVNKKSPVLEFDISKPEGRFVKSADSTRLRHALGKFPIVTVDIEEGIKRMTDWYNYTFKNG